MNLRSLLFLLIAVALIGCDSSSPPMGTGVPAMRVGGNWDGQVTIYSGAADSCVVLAQFELRQNQNADTFNGAVYGGQTCYGSVEGAGETQTFLSPISQGEISGTGVRFVVGDCVYLGLAVGNPVNEIAGSVACPYRYGSWEFAWAGRGEGST